MKCVLAGNATPGRGGQGMNLAHMVACLEDRFALETITAREIATSPVARFIGETRGLRQLRDWQGLFADTHFDARVAARLGPCDVFQGVTGQCLDSLTRARELGAEAALDVVTLHIEDFEDAQREECARFGIRPATHARAVARTCAEYARADVIRVMSPLAAETFHRRGFPAKKIVVGAPPLDLMGLAPIARVPDGKFRVIFVGLIEPWKGFHVLVEAFEKVARADWELVLWGGPGSRAVTNYLEAARARNGRIVVRPEEVRRVGFAEVFGRADVLVQPSFADGFGYSVGEALGSGVPVVVSHRVGAANWVRDGYNGFVVPPGDAEAIAERLLALAADGTRRREMAANAPAIVDKLTLASFREAWAKRLG